MTFVYTAGLTKKRFAGQLFLFLFSRFAGSGQTVCRPSYFDCLGFMKVSERQTRVYIHPTRLLICVFIYNIVVSWWTGDRINTSQGCVFLRVSHPYGRYTRTHGAGGRGKCSLNCKQDSRIGKQEPRNEVFSKEAAALLSNEPKRMK